MKNKLLAVGFTIVLASCGKSKEEQLLYDYQSDNVKSGLNMNVEDLNFEIHEIKEVGKITALDSANMYKEKLAKLWFGEDASKEQLDTISYDYVITRLDTMRSQAQSIILSNIRLGQDWENYEWKKKRDDATDAYVEAKFYKTRDSSFRVKPDSILSIKYQANYSINNPMLNNSKQTFDKYFYSNPEKTKFIREEMVSQEKDS